MVASIIGPSLTEVIPFLVLLILIAATWLVEPHNDIDSVRLDREKQARWLKALV